MSEAVSKSEPSSSEKPKRSGPVRRWLKRIGLLLVVLLCLGVALAWEGMGKSASGQRRARMEASPQWADGVFENPEPLWNDEWGMLTESPADHGSPSEPIPTVQTDPALFQSPPASGLRVTWFGHSSVLLEIGGQRFLLDPVWGPRTSPVAWAGPSRWYQPTIAIEALPELDAVIISHDHYDHLDMLSIKELEASHHPRFIAPLGVGAHLAYWGVPEERITEVDWWEELSFEQTTVACVPARHASGRQITDQNATLWAGYAFVNENGKRVYFSGDTGPFSDMIELGRRYGPFDLTMIEVGQYGQSWPDWHIGPEQAVRAHGWVRGSVLMPIHWGLFDLALHSWTAPIERTLAAAEERGVSVLTVRPGASAEPSAQVSVDRFWPDVPWRNADQYPIRSRGVDELLRLDRARQAQ